MWTDEQRTEALMIATGKGGSASTVVADLRWLRPTATYGIADISLDDDGSHTYAYRGTFTGTALQEFPIDLRTNTSRGQAFWIREARGNDLQVLYADENVHAIDQHGTRNRLDLKLTGDPAAAAVVIVVDPRTHRALAKPIQLDPAGRAKLTVRADELSPQLTSRRGVRNRTR
jgi:hypothetical protein